LLPTTVRAAEDPIRSRRLEAVAKSRYMMIILFSKREEMKNDAFPDGLK
jgi:hypothetical protein